MKVAVLIAVTLIVAGPAVVVAEFVFGSGHILPATLAAVLCLVPATLTFVLADTVWRRWPDFGPVAVMVGTATRMGVAFLGVLVLGEVLAREGVGRERFAVWVTFLYLITLVVESTLLVRGALARDRQRAATTGTT